MPGPHVDAALGHEPRRGVRARVPALDEDGVRRARGARGGGRLDGEAERRVARGTLRVQRPRVPDAERAALQRRRAEQGGDVVHEPVVVDARVVAGLHRARRVGALQQHRAGGEVEMMDGVAGLDADLVRRNLLRRAVQDARVGADGHVEVRRRAPRGVGEAIARLRGELEGRHGERVLLRHGGEAGQREEGDGEDSGCGFHVMVSLNSFRPARGPRSSPTRPPRRRTSWSAAPGCPAGPRPPPRRRRRGA